MVMRAHIIEGGVVTNTVLVHELGPGMLDASLGGSIGDSWDGNTFTPPPPPPPVIPAAVTMRQARLALLGAGLLDDVETAINAMAEPAKTAARIEWDYSSELQRSHPLVTQLGGALGLDDAALDSLFVTAAGL